MSHTMPPEVADVFDSYPTSARTRLLLVRQLTFDTASATQGVGPLTETLKWGEPAYLTAVSKSGSTIRLGWKRSTPHRYVVFFDCKTTLVETFRTLMPNTFMFEGNRAILLESSESVPEQPLAVCLALALTYHSSKRQRVSPDRYRKARTPRESQMS